MKLACFSKPYNTMDRTHLEFEGESERVRARLCQAIGLINAHFRNELKEVAAILWTEAAMWKARDLGEGAKVIEARMNNLISIIQNYPVSPAKELYMEELLEVLGLAVMAVEGAFDKGWPGRNKEIQLFNLLESSRIGYVGSLTPHGFEFPTAITTLLSHWRLMGELQIDVLAGGDIHVKDFGTFTQEEVISAAKKYSCYKYAEQSGGGKVNWQSYVNPWRAFQECELAYGTLAEVEKVPQKFMDTVLDIVREYRESEYKPIMPTVTICSEGWAWRYDEAVFSWIPEMMECFSTKVGVNSLEPPTLEPSCVYYDGLVGILVFANTYELLKAIFPLPLEVWGLQFCFSVGRFFDVMVGGWRQSPSDVIAKYGETAIRDLMNRIVMPFESRTLAKLYDTGSISELIPHIPPLFLGFNLFKEAREKKRGEVYLDVNDLSPDQREALEMFTLENLPEE